MNENEAKAKRTTAKRIFTRTENGFTRALECNVDSEVVESRFEQVSAAWFEVQKCHEHYVEALGSPDDSEALDEWISELQSRYLDTEIRKFTYAKSRLAKETVEKAKVRENFERTEGEHMQKIQVAYHSRESAYHLFRCQADFLNSIISEVVSETNPIELVLNAHEKLATLYEKT